MNSSAKLTDTQLVVLSAASQREDRRVIMPDKLRGGAASKLLATLSTKEMIELFADGEQVDRPPAVGLAGLTNYRISAAGLSCIGVGEVAPNPVAASDVGNISDHPLKAPARLSNIRPRVFRTLRKVVMNKLRRARL